MSELILVLKSLIFATIVAVLLQFQIQGKTIENHLINLAGSQQVQSHLQLAAKGAVSIAEKTITKVQTLTQDVLNSFKSNTSYKK
ncbi:MAG: hypothetical protein ACK5V3_17115 [Bdellovibrionales bacterium]